VTVHISVVIPAYNAALFIAEAIESVFQQEGCHLEVVVVDDGSTDGTAGIAGSFAGVTVVTRQNGGSGAARNSGLREVTAPYIAFLDADDVWPTGRMNALIEALSADLDAVFGQAAQFGAERAETAPQPALLPGTMLIRREACERIGEFQEDVKVGEFVDWWARAEEAGVRWTQIPHVVLRRRIHTTNTGIVHADARLDYARVLRAALQRRRQAP
jgi:glycosyltransferase involved in cell wall biosynthesis